jgi:hypothetical protein
MKEQRDFKSSTKLSWGEERDFEVPISLGNHPFAWANTQFPKNWGPKLGCPRNMGNWNIQPTYPKEKGIWKFQPRCPNKGLRCFKETWFFPRGQGAGMPGETWLGQRRGLSDNPQRRFHLDLFSLGKLQLPRLLANRNCIGITFSFVISVVPLKKNSEKGSKPYISGLKRGSWTLHYIIFLWKYCTCKIL